VKWLADPFDDLVLLGRCQFVELGDTRDGTVHALHGQLLLRQLVHEGDEVSACRVGHVAQSIDFPHDALLFFIHARVGAHSLPARRVVPCGERQWPEEVADGPPQVRRLQAMGPRVFEDRLPVLRNQPGDLHTVPDGPVGEKRWLLLLQVMEQVSDRGSVIGREGMGLDARIGSEKPTQEFLVRRIRQEVSPSNPLAVHLIDLRASDDRRLLSLGQVRQEAELGLELRRELLRRGRRLRRHHRVGLDRLCRLD
jgi:hypothetical protein